MSCIFLHCPIRDAPSDNLPHAPSTSFAMTTDTFLPLLRNPSHISGACPGSIDGVICERATVTIYWLIELVRGGISI